MLGIIKKKACKKCGGDLSLECDIYGVYIQCIQCGANWNEEDIGLKPRDAEAMLKEIIVRQSATMANKHITTQIANSVQPGATRVLESVSRTEKSAKRVIVPFPDNRLSQFPDP